MAVQPIGGITSSSNFFAQDLTAPQTLVSEAEEMRAWLRRPIPSTPAPAVPSAPTEMQALMTPNTPPAGTSGRVDMFM